MEIRTSNSAQKTYNLGPIKRGAWNSFVFHIRRSTGGDGVAEAWRDGEKVATHTGAASYTTNNNGVWKHGIYTRGIMRNQKEYILYFDDVKIARGPDQYNAVYTPSEGAVFTPGPCSTITSGAVASPYGTPYNVLSPQKELLVSVVCEENKTVLTVGNGNTGNPSQNYQGLTYVWHKAYYHPGTAWTETTLTCPTTLISGTWCPQKATADLPTNAAWTVGFTCTWWNGAWQCGCTDASCSASFWQIQGVNR